MDAWQSQKLPFSKKRLPKKVIFSYLVDYLIIIALIVAFTILDAVEPYHQHFSLRNYTLQYPYAVHERVPVSMLIVYVVFAPAVIIAIYTLLIDGLFSHQDPVPGTGKRKLTGRYRFKDRAWELNCGILGLALAVGAAFTITGTLKNAIGKPRPDLIDRCQPNMTLARTEFAFDLPSPQSYGVAVITSPYFGLSNHSICTQTDNAILKDGFRSFPSGHSSTAFAGLFYLSIYLAGKLHVLDSKGEVWKAFIVLIPTLGAALIAGSRIMDARHHPFDVLFGSLLGILVAWASYRQYFPPIHESWRKGRAYPIRSWGKSPQPPGPYAIQRSDTVESLGLPEGVEPLRKAPTDEERPSPTVPPSSAGGSGNVFRAQIEASQRARQAYGDGGAVAVAGEYEAQLGRNNPFGSSLRSGSTRRRMDYYGESSSEEDNEDAASSAYELRSTYSLSRPDRGISPVPVTAAGGYTGLNVDTGYHGGAVAGRGMPLGRLSSIRESSGTLVGSGDLGSPLYQQQEDVPPVPPAHGGGGPGGAGRGVQLVETYAR